MSIPSVTTLPSAVSLPAKEEPTQSSGTSFQDALSRASDSEEGGAVSPETAAEILRLKMMSSALYLGDDQARPAPSPLGNVQALLDKFLAHRAPTEEGSAATGAAAAEVPVRGVAAGDTSTDAIIQKAAQRFGLDQGLIKAVIRAESGFNPTAVSSAGAQGLMQLMPDTARGLGVSNAFDPEQNVMAGSRFLKEMLQRYNGNLDAALAAYNWGPRNVDRNFAGMPRETRAYLAKVKGYYAQYQA